MRSKTLLLGCAGLLLAFVPNAGATLQLTLISGGTTVTVNDNGPGDSNPFTGAITFIGSVGNWSLNITTGKSGTNPLIDLNSQDTLTGNGTGINTLTLEFTGTGFSGPVTQFSSAIGGTLANGVSASYIGYVDASNAMYGMATPILPTQNFGPCGSAGCAFSGTVFGGSVPAGSYSGTEVVILSGNNGAGISNTSSFDAALDAVPEPAGVLLLGGALLFSAGTIRRKLTGNRS